ncbi:MAG: efflux RND transporter periplasmic adaptor subunit [Patescibacteria group bacterium]
MKKNKRWLWILVIVILAIIGIWWWLSSKNKKVDYSTILVKSAPLLQTVNESGTVMPIKEIALNFLSSGRIKTVNVKVGDKVTKDKVLASLDDSSLQVRKTEAEAGLSMAKATLSKLMAGASSETVNISRSSLAQAQATIASAKTDLEKIKKTVAENIRQAEKTSADLESTSSSTITPQEQSVAQAKTALDNAQKNGQKTIDNTRSSAVLTINDKILNAKIALDNINTLLTDDSATNVLGAKNSSSLNQAKDARLAALALIPSAESLATKARQQNDENSISLAGEAVKKLLIATDDALDYAYAMLESSIVSSSFSQTKLDSYKTIISSQVSQVNGASSALEVSIQNFHNAVLNKQTSVASAEDNLGQAQVNLDNAKLAARNALSSVKLSGDQQISSAQARLNSANNSLAVSQAQYINTVAPARAQDISVAQAQVNQAQATLDGINQQIKDSLLVSPLDGVVNQVNFEVGEQFSPSAKSMVSILVNNSFNVEVDIAESNISKIKIGNQVDLTLDAFPGDLILKGQVSFIEPAQTVIQDVVYYKVKIDFTNINEIISLLDSKGLSLKSGMTTNVVIMTEKRDQALQVPARSLIEKDSQTIVRLLVDGLVQEVAVKTGLRGDEGMVEILSGLKEGDNVITFIKTTTPAPAK